MKFSHSKLVLSALSLSILSACGGSSSSSDPKDPPLNENVAPLITSSAPTTATEDIAYTYTLAVTDPDDANNGSDLSFSLNNAPQGMAISNTGEITWTPTEGVLSANDITVVVRDGGENGAAPAEQTFSITVTPVNDSPTITSSALTTATEDIAYTYSVTASDVDDEVASLTYELENAPTGMTINGVGEVSWTPLEGVLSANDIKVLVRDGGEDGALAAEQVFSIAVTPVNDAPQLSVIENQQVETGQSLGFTLVATDPDDENNGEDLSFAVVEGPAGLAISPTGEVSFTSAATTTTDSQVTISVADGGEDNAAAATQSFMLSELVYLPLSGLTYHYYTNDPIENATATLSDGTQVLASALTDATGLFNLRVLDNTVNDRMVLTANSTGFGEASLTLSQQDFAQQQALYIAPVHATQTFNVAQATELLVEGQTIVSLPTDAFVDGNGNAVTGDVTAEMLIINPQSDIDLMPGEMVTRDDTGNLVPIESFGAITVDFTDAQGNKVQLGENKTATINIPAVGTAPPATIPLYYYDTEQGVWVEEGEATLTTINGDQFYQGEVSHFTTWNADKIYETVFVKGCVVDDNDVPVSGIRIRGEGQDYNGSSSARTDSNGEFNLAVKSFANTLISAAFGQVSRTVSITSQGVDIELDTCLKLSENFTRIQLNWGESPRDLDSWFTGPDGQGDYFYVYWSDKQVTVGDEVIWLDVDDVSSYGPEVISVPSYPFAGRYRYVVHRFSSIGFISGTETRVELNLGGQRRLYTPTGDSDLRFWHVFDIVVSDSGSIEVVDVNEFKAEFPLLSGQQMKLNNESYPSRLKQFLKSKYYAQ